MDERSQPLTGAEQNHLKAEAAVSQAEAETGTTAIPRTYTTEEPDPADLDPRFDRDDLRQGKPPPAVRHRHLPRKVKIRRPRAKKGLPFKNKGKEGAEGATTDGEAEEADMTEEEIEVDDDQEDDVSVMARNALYS
ncbi:hypothetical protein CBS101457_004792 [Exobasidium rhododendri]|nr:hypothetical protein CBS101457_004792 [Exobasidium rhododendri]